MKTIIIKIGTKVLSKTDGTLDEEYLAHAVSQIAQLKKRGLRVVLVTSGAVGAGKSMLSLGADVNETVRKQIFAAVGQVKLMSTYARLFSEHGFHCAQVLATKEDFRDEVHYENMRNCFEGLLLDNVIPIVNENDVVATTELLFTDNDELAGLVARQLKADCLAILTGTEGILDADMKTVARVDGTNITRVEGYVTPEKSSGGRGGMVSKFKTARSLAEEGIEVRIVNGRRAEVLLELAAGKESGTTFVSAV